VHVAGPLFKFERREDARGHCVSIQNARRKRKGEEILKCRICSRDAVENGYCELHAKAYENVTKNYEVWRKALELSWKEYLSEIVKNPLTGERAKEVAQYLSLNKE